jgi:hypothetical protein
LEVDVEFFLELLKQLVEAWQVVRACSPHFHFLVLAAEEEELHEFVFVSTVGG